MSKLVTAVIKNNVPSVHVGVMMHNIYGIRPSFAKEGKKIVFQAGIKMHFVESATGKILFDFITATNFEIKKTINDEGFYELIYSHILTAIEDFNRHIDAAKGFLITEKYYTENIPFKKTKEAIRIAWLTYNLPRRSNN